jgi:hypothetical protein
MNAEEKLFTDVGKAIKGSEFGKPCFKINGKAFVCFFENKMVFKLNDAAHEAALKLRGSVLFDPSGKGRPMKEWVQVAFTHKTQWPALAKASVSYVKSIQ